MRIGLFGGTFNPIHFGHLRAVLEVRERFGLGRVYLIPSAMPPHKSQVGIASPSDRLEMIQQAVENDPDFVVSDVELMRTGPSYTIDTLSFFAEHAAGNGPAVFDPRPGRLSRDSYLEKIYGDPDSELP